MAQQASTRRAVTEGMLDLAAVDDRVVLVSSDSIGVIKAQDFVETYPQRVFEMGISEQSAMAASAGMATCGLIPYYVSYSVFATMRACEQLRTVVAYPELPVRIIGANGGMASGEREGVTHQGIEDLGITRAIPGITILVPSDAGQVRKALVAAVDIPGPVYIRTGSGREPLFNADDTPFQVGSTRVLADHGSDIVLFACGFVLPIVMKAAESLRAEGIGAKVVEVPTLKPLQSDEIMSNLQACGCSVTIEDHTVIGGLGSAVCELSAEHGLGPVRRVGLMDTYPESGSPEELYEAYGINEERIVSQAQIVLKMRK